jgi:pyruvate dehydrogenase E1 component alpha subunit
MNVADRDAGLLGGNGIVGGGLSVAAGQAWAFKTLKSGHVAMCFFGDGAAQTGAFHESLNLASLWSLPVVFVCDHNEYGLTVRASVQSSVANIADRAAAYAMPGITLDGNDVLGVFETSRTAVERARAGGGPTLIEAKTYRITGFSTSDVGGYQPDEEIEVWKARDPLLRSERQLISIVGKERVSELHVQARSELDEAFKRALAAPYPDPSELREPEFAVS